LEIAFTLCLFRVNLDGQLCVWVCVNHTDIFPVNTNCMLNGTISEDEVMRVKINCPRVPTSFADTYYRTWRTQTPYNFWNRTERSWQFNPQLQQLWQAGRLPRWNFNWPGS